MVLTAIGFAAYGLTKIAYNYFVLRRFGPETLAVNNLSLSAALLMSILISNLFATSMSRFAAEALGRQEQASFLFVVSFNLWLLLGCSALAALGFLLFSGWIAVQVGTTPESIRIGAALVVLNTVYTYFKALSYVVQEVRQYTVLEIVSALIFFVALFFCLHWNRRDLLLLPFLLQFGFFALWSAVLNRKVIWHVAAFRQWTKRARESAGMMRYSVITGFGTTGSMIVSHVFTLTLGHIADARAVAFFSSVSAALDPLNLVPRLLTTVTFPRIARLLGQGQTGGLVHFTRQNYRRLLVFTAVSCVGALVMAPELTTVLFGRGTHELLPFVRIMLLARFLPVIGVFHVSFLSGTHFPLFPNLMGPLALVVTLPLLPVGLGAAGLAGVGGVVLLSSVIRTFPTLAYGEAKLTAMARQG